ncbi:MAG: transglycosylase SLT domain-containing protein [Acidobacteria bacterium]|nr:transglycosylase SLT domain-containing protein [Acidobacteriota bacterium]
MPPRPQLDGRIRRADERFEAGRKLYLQGEFAAAREEFDKAIETLLASSETAPDRLRMEKKLEDLVDRIHRYDLEGLGAGNTDQPVAYDKAPIEEFLEMTFPIDPGLKTKVKDQVAATASQLPLEENDEVLRYINFFSSERGKRTLIAGLKRAGKYKDMIRRILNEEGVPQEMIYLAQAESGFYPRAVSYRAAVGMWQFVQFRGREYGLNQTPWSDDRLDPEKATRAAARHLRDLYQQFGDWYLAMAAYNCGPGCVTKAVQRTGYADFWQLRSRNALPRETTNYVPLIVAMTIMVKNSRDYGIQDVVPDPPLLYDSVEMGSNTSLALLADLADISLPELREMNPSLLKDMVPAGSPARIPKGSLENVVSSLNMIPPDKRASSRTHRVQDGETLTSIANRYRTPTGSIAAVNRAAMDDLRTGDLVVIPIAYTAPKPQVTRNGRSVRTNGRAVASKQRPANRQAAPQRKPAAPVSKATNAKKTPAKKSGPAVAVRTAAKKSSTAAR